MKTTKLLTIGLLGAGLQSFLFAASLDDVSFADNSSTVVAEASGIAEFTGASSAVFSIDGKRHRIGTQGTQLIGAVRESTVATPFGNADLLAGHVWSCRLSISVYAED